MKINPSKVNLSEKDIEDYLWENPNEVKFNYRGDSFHIDHWLARQFRVPSGIIDLFGVLNTGDPAVVEVKNVPIDAKALAQVRRYARDIEFVMSERYHNGFPDITCIVVGESIDNQALHEAQALNVATITFSVNLSLELGTVRWTEEYLQKIWSTLNEISKNDDLFSVFDEQFSPRYEEEIRQENIEENHEIVSQEGV